jgi:hypothetical protein
MFQNILQIMSEFDLTSFVMWGTISGIAMLVFGFAYRRYLKK